MGIRCVEHGLKVPYTGVLFNRTLMYVLCVVNDFENRQAQEANDS